MGQPKLIVHKSYKGKRRSENVFAAIFHSAAGLTQAQKNSIKKQTEQSQDSLCSGKGATNGTSEEWYKGPVLNIFISFIFVFGNLDKAKPMKLSEIS